MFRRILCRGICLPLVFPSETLFRRRQKDRERVREPRTFADMSLLRVCVQSCHFSCHLCLCGHVPFILVQTCHFCSLVRTCSLFQSCADMFTFAVLCGHVHFCSLVRTCSLCGHVHVHFAYSAHSVRVRDRNFSPGAKFTPPRANAHTFSTRTLH